MVWTVLLRWRDWSSRRCALVHMGPSKEEARTAPFAIHFRTVPPEATMTKPVWDEFVRFEPQDVDFPGAWAEVIFTDSSGRKWRRDAEGRLFELTERPGRRPLWRRVGEPA
jgi:hypothetical protein